MLPPVKGLSETVRPLLGRVHDRPSRSVDTA
jgi:hypothetical protein